MHKQHKTAHQGISTNVPASAWSFKTLQICVLPPGQGNSHWLDTQHNHWQALHGSQRLQHMCTRCTASSQLPCGLGPGSGHGTVHVLHVQNVHTMIILYTRSGCTSACASHINVHTLQCTHVQGDCPLGQASLLEESQLAAADRGCFQPCTQALRPPSKPEQPSDGGFLRQAGGSMPSPGLPGDGATSKPSSCCCSTRPPGK